MISSQVCALLSAALLLTGFAQAETYRWDSVATGGGGFVSGIIPSKSERGVVYARTDVGGAYRWNAHDERWVSMMDWVPEAQVGLMGVASLAIDPKDAGRIYLMAGTSYFNGGKSAILRSSDYGRTFDVIDVTARFKVHGNAIGRQNGERLQVDPGDGRVLYAGSQYDGLFRSGDAGTTWERLASLPVTTTPNGAGISFVLLDPASVEGGSARRIFVGVSRQESAGPNLYVSHDAGASFEPVEGGPAGLMPQGAVMSPEGRLYLTYANGAGPHPTEGEPMDRGQVWEYDAVGGNWADITPAGASGPFGGISIDPADPRHLVASTVNTWRQQGSGWGDRIYTTRNAGRDWVDVVERGFAIDPKGIDWITGSSIHWAGDIEFDPFDSKTAWVISGNGVFRTTDIDAPTTRWGFDVRGLEETVAFAMLSVPGGPLVSVIGDYDGFVQDDPAQYGVRHSPAMGTTTSLAGSTDGRVLARAGSGIYYSTDTGASWAKAAAINGSHGKLAVSADGQLLLHSPERASTTYRSTDFGTSWSVAAGLAVADAHPIADAVDPRRFYAYDNVNGRMLVSDDGGATFTARGQLPAQGLKTMAAAPGRAGDVWVCLAGRGLAHTSDAGATFETIAGVDSCTAVALGKAAPGTAYPALYMWGTVHGVRGMLRSIDKGASWSRINDDAHQYGGTQSIAGDLNTYGTVYMTSAGRGIVYGATAGDAGDVIVAPIDTSGPGPAEPPNRCEYVITTAWEGGHIADLRITNNRSATIHGWTVSWTYGDNSTVDSWWNAAVTGAPPTWTATADQPWNTNIGPGATVSFGMVVTGSSIPVISGDVCK
ncbi:cellulose binding domain-containing protein [Pseudoduganella sp. SL102]|uniref:cellulose binding domain-containing protein n=1 Tax=Pseudoduganella sp. SL102 TaxID=2995154 RepID=UPI00248A9958|nr:cellulose binding domain-containing protein [Pseudoduganella sp. SL102]WBS01132.1 cellulose binding domain-containing protein [Pseudoduganella sp. SL102]